MKFYKVIEKVFDTFVVRVDTRMNPKINPRFDLGMKTTCRQSMTLTE